MAFWNRKKKTTAEPAPAAIGPIDPKPVTDPAPEKIRFPEPGQRTVETSFYERQLVTQSISTGALFTAIDMARVGDTRQLFALYRDFVLTDSHVLAELSKRKLAVIGDRLTIQPADPDNADDVAAAEFIKENTVDLPVWPVVCGALLDATMWPTSIVEKVFRVDSGRYCIDTLVHVPHYLEDYVTGHLRLRKTDENGMPQGEYWDPPEPERYIVHRGHLLTFPSEFGGPMRALLFWTLFRLSSRDWWARFLDRFGSPFMVGKYEAGDDATRALLNQAFSVASRLFGIAVSREVEISLQQANTSNGDAFKLLIEVANDEISKLIVGQTLSSTAKSTGMGSGVANLQGEVRDDIRQFDALMLLSTVKAQLVDPLLEVNNMPGKVQMIWGSASNSQLRTKVGLLKDLYGAGLTISDESLPTLSDDVGMQIIRTAPAPSAFGAPPPLSADSVVYRTRRQPREVRA